MKLSKHAKFWALGALGGVGLFALGVFAQQNGALDIDSTNQDLFSDLKAVFFLDRNGDEIDSIVRLNVSNGTVVSAPTSDLAGGEAKNTLQNNASIIGSTNSVNTSSGAFLIATNNGRVEGESMQSFVWGASNTTLKGYNAIAVATKNTKLEADNTLALAAKDSTVLARDSVVLGGERITINPAGEASLAVWSKINVLGASGALVFNGKPSLLQVDTASAHTMVVNADNGLIINTNNSNNQKIQLTVNGAIKLGAVTNAPAQTSPYISVKTKGSVTCVCGRVNNQNSALSKYTRGNKQIADLCQKVCDDQNTTLTAQCGAAATNYPLTQTQWSTDDFCQWGLGHAGAKPTFPTLGGQVSWTCESFPSGGPTCTATRKGCWDGIRAAGEQCDLGTNNGKPDSNCSVSCENVKAPKCWANAKTYLGSDVAWAQPNGFCTDGSVLGEATPAFWNGSTSWQKTWTCKNKNNKNLTCSATKQPPMIAGECNKNKVNICITGVFSGETSLKNGTRWTCKGEHGGSSKTCSTCDSGYTYNETSTKCEANCANPIYRHTNGVTIKAADCAEAGKEYMFEGQKYYVARDKDDIKAKIAANTYPANRIVTTRVTEFNQLFYDNHTFNQDIWNWDTSNVTNMYGMFRAAVAFNQQINNWDTSKVTTMQYMFYNARAFNQQINNWDTSKVTNMNAMFYNAITFNQPLNNWNTSNVTDMSLMFANIEVFNQPLNNWNTSKVTNMAAMFTSAKVFNQPLNNWNTSNITNMYAMFYWAKAFNQPLNNWDTSNVTNMYGMFRAAVAFNQPLNNWNISKVTDMKYMFYWAETFNQPLNNRRINQISDENLKDIFGNATAFKENQPYCNWANWSAKKWNFVNMGLNACINGQCKAYPWNHASQPATSTTNGCIAGDYQDIADDTNSWKWKCIGKYSGTSTECSASKQPTCPSGFTSSNGKCVKWECKKIASSYTPGQCGGGTYTETALSAPYCTLRSMGLLWNGNPTAIPELCKKLSNAECSNPKSSGVEAQAYYCGIPNRLLSSFTSELNTLWGYNGVVLEECKGKNAEYSICQISQGSTTSTHPCSSLSHESECTAKNCTRTPWTWTPASAKLNCIDNLWNTLPDSQCASLWSKPTCSPDVEQNITITKVDCSWIHFHLNGNPNLWTTDLTFSTDGKTWWAPKNAWQWNSPREMRSTYPKKWWLRLLYIKSGSWIWTGIAEYDISSCYEQSKINGQCKTYPWNHTSQPATNTANGCVAGDYQDIADDSNNWKWKCNGKNGGTSTECSASKQPAPVNGQCKTHAWTHASQPANSTTNGCLAGEYEDMTDGVNSWKWKCKGKNWGTEDICSSIKEAYTPEIRLEEISHWSEYCWGNRYVHVTIKNPKWRSMKIEHSHTISSISNWGKVDMRWKEYSRKLQKQTSDQQYEFDLQKIPSSPICDWSVEGEFSVYVTVDWKETVMTHSYLNITKDEPYAPCCLVEDPLKSGLWGTQCIPHSYWSVEARNAAHPHLQVKPKEKGSGLWWLESVKEQKWIRCD